MVSKGNAVNERNETVNRSPKEKEKRKKGGSGKPFQAERGHLHWHICQLGVDLSV